MSFTPIVNIDTKKHIIKQIRPKKSNNHYYTETKSHQVTKIQPEGFTQTRKLQGDQPHGS